MPVRDFLKIEIFCDYIIVDDSTQEIVYKSSTNQMTEEILSKEITGLDSLKSNTIVIYAV